MAAHLHVFLLVKEAMNTLRLVHTSPCAYFQGEENIITFLFFLFPKRDKGGTYIQILPHLLCDWVRILEQAERV